MDNNAFKLKPHNIKPFKEIVNAYHEGKNKILYVAGTGTGKSYVFMKVVKKLKAKKILYIFPKYSIEENINRYEEFNDFKVLVDFITYNYFSTREKSIDKLSEYDFVLIDEAHHLGSDIYGSNILFGIENNSKVNFLGLTATPIRDSDEVDVSIFFDERINGISTFEAIKKGLMPKINYRACYPFIDVNEINKIAVKNGSNVRVKVNPLDSIDVVKKVMQSFPRDKWICFFSTEQNLYDSLEDIRKEFSNYEIFILTASLNNLKEVIDGVKKVNKAIILSINILLEGVHFADIDGIILFRSVTSLTVFSQMIGRICSIGKKIEPVVIDCSNTGTELLARLMNYNMGINGTSPMIEYMPNDWNIIKVGIGFQKEFDIEKLLSLVNGRNTSHTEKTANARAALNEYYIVTRNTYSSLEELKSNKTDYKIAKAAIEVKGPTTMNLFITEMIKGENL